jgi:type IV secretory pathway VirB10-like protein
VATAASVLLHVAVLLALLTVVRNDRAGTHPQARPKAIHITLAPDAKPAPPKPVEPPKQETPPPTPAPAPIPQPSLKPTPAKPAAKPSPPPPAAAAQTAPAEPTEAEEIENVVGRIHDNWLEPPDMPRSFNCRIHIDYSIDGRITAVKFLKGCGGLVLDDSVKRAIWKTQPLPLIRAKREAGSFEFDFTP